VQTPPELYLPIMYGGAGAVGLISCFFGYKLFKLIVTALLAVAGAASLAWMGYQFGAEPVLWSAGGLILGAILGAVLAIFFYSVAVGTIGALFVATSLIPWIQHYELWMQWTILGIACTIAALLAGVLTNLMIQLASAMLGALLIVHSAQFFLTGQTIHQTAEGEDGWILYLQMDPYVAGGALILGLVGFFVQRRMAK